MLELGGEAGAVGEALHLDVVTPGAASGRAPPAGFGAAWIPLGRHRIVVGCIPVAALLLHVVAHLVDAVCVRLRATHGLRADLPITTSASAFAVQPLRK